MTKNTKLIIAICLASAALAACGSNNNTATPPVITPPAARLEDQFGANFGTAYRADPNTDATDPAAGDIIPLDPTKDAVTI